MSCPIIWTGRVQPAKREDGELMLSTVDKPARRREKEEMIITSIICIIGCVLADVPFMRGQRKKSYLAIDVGRKLYELQQTAV